MRTWSAEPSPFGGWLCILLFLAHDTNTDACGSVDAVSMSTGRAMPSRETRMCTHHVRRGVSRERCSEFCCHATTGADTRTQDPDSPLSPTRQPHGRVRGSLDLGCLSEAEFTRQMSPWWVTRLLPPTGFLDRRFSVLTWEELHEHCATERPQPPSE